MGYLNEDGLARYDGLIKNWVTFKSGTVDGIDPLLNWQKTSAAGAVTFYPLPAAPIDPVVNFLFTESGPASGTKGPDNPSTIAGVSSVKVTRCGKNLGAVTAVSDSNPVSGISFAVNEDNTITVKAISSTAERYFTIKYVKVPAGTYTISGCPANGASNTYFLTAFYTGSGSIRDYGSGATFTISEPKTVQLAICIRSGMTVSNLVFKPQIELGSTATSFEPYDGTDYTVNLGGTYYGGSVDLSTGVMTVTWTAVRLGDFQNSLQYNSANNRWEIFVTPKADYSINAICTHSIFKNGSEFTDATDGVFRWAAGNLGQWFWFKSPAATKEAFLAIYGNAYVAFVLAPSYTVQLTPTQIYSLSQTDPYTPRLNTVYSDQVSVQVGYPKSPLATSIELTNAIVSLGGNI